GLSGLAGDPDRGVLWGVAQVDQLYEIDASTGAVLNHASLQSVGYEQDLAYSNGQLVVSDAVFFGSGGGVLQFYDPTTFALVNQVTVATTGFVSGLGGDGVGGAAKDDWYSINV